MKFKSLPVVVQVQVSGSYLICILAKKTEGGICEANLHHLMVAQQNKMISVFFEKSRTTPCGAMH